MPEVVDRALLSSSRAWSTWFLVLLDVAVCFRSAIRSAVKALYLFLGGFRSAVRWAVKLLYLYLGA